MGEGLSIVTARKRSLRRLCFHRCLSGGGVCILVGGLHPGGGVLHPGGVCIGGRGLGRLPPPSDTTGYSQRVDGTHPTEMHSCLMER